MYRFHRAVILFDIYNSTSVRGKLGYSLKINNVYNIITKSCKVQIIDEVTEPGSRSQDNL